MPLGQLNIANEGSGVLKPYQREGWHWLPAGIGQISGIQRVEALILVISGLNWSILNIILHISSFTKKVGLMIASSRSGTFFSSCLTSSTHFSITKNMLLIGSTCFCVQGHTDSIPSDPFLLRERRIAIPASLMRVDHGLNFFMFKIFDNFWSRNAVSC